MSKTPFELRTDILQLSRDYLNRQSELNRDIMNRALDVFSTKENIDAFKSTSDLMKAFNDQVEQLQKLYPVSFKPSDILKQAENFYDFVKRQ